MPCMDQEDSDPTWYYAAFVASDGVCLIMITTFHPRATHPVSPQKALLLVLTNTYLYESIQSYAEGPLKLQEQIQQLRDHGRLLDSRNDDLGVGIVLGEVH